MPQHWAPDSALARKIRGYRIYFGEDGERLVILLGGGTKKRQSADIEAARRLWQEYKARKKVER